MQTISNLGETELISLLRHPWQQHPNPAWLGLGPGDDAAIINPAGPVVVSTDTMVEGADFLHHWPHGVQQSGHSVGFKAVAQNLSDINAMGCIGQGIFLSLSLPATTPVAWVRDFACGLYQACTDLGAHQAYLAGGDVGRAEQLSITITMLGAPANTGQAQYLKRDAATIGDGIYLAGRLGWAAAGLQLLQQGPSTATGAEFIQAQFYPQPPLAAGPEALSHGARCGMDVSDGLVADLEKILLASSAHTPVAAQLDAAVLDEAVAKVAPAAANVAADEAALLAWSWVLTGGEDYGLLVTAPESAGLTFPRIGAIVAREEGQALIDCPADAPAGLQQVLRSPRGGFDHFR